MGDSLGDRIKSNYENRARHQLTRRTPVIIRVDGKAFHTLTAKCEKPFDLNLIDIMAGAAQDVSGQIQGFKMGYVQSDEASFLLTDFEDISTDAWFDYGLQKMASVTASMMTLFFNRRLAALWESPLKNGIALFDARCFNIPMEEVSNYFLWRAKDWERNSLQMVARANYSAKELHGKKRADLHELLHQKGINWNDLHPQLKNGTFLFQGKVKRKFDIEPVYDQIQDALFQAMEKK